MLLPSRSSRWNAPESSSRINVDTACAYGGFLIPQALNLSFQSTGGYAAAFLGFVGAYVVLLVLTYVVYVRSSRLREHKI